METFRLLTYWFVGVNVVATTLFSAVCIILGARDLVDLLRTIKKMGVDDSDDGFAAEQ